jgi:hypothetical protein
MLSLPEGGLWVGSRSHGGSGDNLKAHAEFMTHLPPQLQQMVAQLSDSAPDWYASLLLK